MATSQPRWVAPQRVVPVSALRSQLVPAPHALRSQLSHKTSNKKQNSILRIVETRLQCRNLISILTGSARTVEKS